MDNNYQPTQDSRPNPFHAVAEHNPGDALLLAQAFSCVHHEWDEVWPVLRFIRRAACNDSGRNLGSYIHGLHFAGVYNKHGGPTLFNPDDNGDAETLRDMAHDYLETL